MQTVGERVAMSGTSTHGENPPPVAYISRNAEQLKEKVTPRRVSSVSTL